jgi:hypothetical protein
VFLCVSHRQNSCKQLPVCQNLVPLVNIKIAGKWMVIPLKMVLIGIDPYPHSKWENRHFEQVDQRTK